MPSAMSGVSTPSLPAVTMSAGWNTRFPAIFAPHSQFCGTLRYQLRPPRKPVRSYLDGLVHPLTALYGSDITVDELREEVDLSRESLVQEYTEDALDAYNDRETGFGPS